MINLKSLKTQLILCLSAIAAFLIIKDQDVPLLLTLVVAVFSAVIVEGALIYLRTRTLALSESSVITGLIVGYVISSNMPWWQVLLASVVAIIGKYVIRFQGRHIFNPAAFGIFIVLILFHAQTQWTGTYLWYIFMPIGLYFSYRLKKIEIIAGYAFFSLLLFGGQAFMQKIPPGEIFGYFSYFYIFIMVIEPKTTPQRRIGKYLFGSGVAIMAFLLTELGIPVEVEIVALLMMNAAVPFLNKL